MAKAPKLDANGYRKFGLLDKLSYAAGDAGCNCSFALVSSLLNFIAIKFIYPLDKKTLAQMNKDLGREV